jgi:hypothetical protein
MSSCRIYQHTDKFKVTESRNSLILRPKFWTPLFVAFKIAPNFHQMCHQRGEIFVLYSKKRMRICSLVVCGSRSAQTSERRILNNRIQHMSNIYEI